MLNVESLAQEIRRIDGSHSLGAAALAEALIPFIREHGSALLAELGQEVGAVAWRPIADAPKDGTRIVMVNAESGGSGTGMWRDWCDRWVEFPYIHGAPTHWAHIPKETT